MTTWRHVSPDKPLKVSKIWKAHAALSAAAALCPRLRDVIIEVPLSPRMV